eukprot:5043863-Prymnesium_polylepis.1
MQAPRRMTTGGDSSIMFCRALMRCISSPGLLYPPRLSALDPIDMTGYSAVTVPPVGSKLNEHLAALEHNRK